MKHTLLSIPVRILAILSIAISPAKPTPPPIATAAPPSVPNHCTGAAYEMADGQELCIAQGHIVESSCCCILAATIGEGLALNIARAARTELKLLAPATVAAYYKASPAMLQWLRGPIARLAFPLALLAMLLVMLRSFRPNWHVDINRRMGQF